MTYPELLTAIYKHYDTLLKQWDTIIEDKGLVVFTFFPECYENEQDFAKVSWEIWDIDRMRAYFAAGGISDQGLDNLLQDFGFGEEFLVMIVEYDGSVKRHVVHVHKITSLGLN